MKNPVYFANYIILFSVNLVMKTVFARDWKCTISFSYVLYLLFTYLNIIHCSLQFSTWVVSFRIIRHPGGGFPTEKDATEGTNEIYQIMGCLYVSCYTNVSFLKNIVDDKMTITLDKNVVCRMQDYRKCHLRYSCILSLDTSRMQEYRKCKFLFPLSFSQLI